MSTAEEVPKAGDATQENDEWIVQSKPRRLVPQHSLSRQDLEADKSKVVVAPAADTKKKVIRFTKEEMMTFRQPAKLLSHMAEMVEVISTDRLNPVCFERFEPEDVIRIWNTEKNGPGGNKGADAMGRGRGRGKPGFKAGEEGESAEWAGGNQPQTQTRGNKGGLWDDAGASSANGGDGLDLEDFAAMALKFRSEMEQMKLSGEGGEGSAAEEDMMERLLREQNMRGGIEDEEGEEELPDWANDDVAEAPAPQPAAKRSLLLETLNVKQQPAAQAAVVTTSTTSSYTVGGGLNTGVTATVSSSSSNVLLSTPAPPPLLRLESTEWLYTDPQGQVQGPFEQENMRQWNEAGYFSHDLPIKLRHWNAFHTFQTVFPDSKRAFLLFPQEPLSGSSLLLSLQQQQQAEAQRQAAIRQQQILQQQQEEAQRKAELEAQQRQRQQMVEQEQLRQQQILQQQQQQAQQLLLQQQQQAQQAEAQRQAQILAQQQQQAAQIEQQRTLLEQQRQQAAAPSGPPAVPAQKATAAPWANKQPGSNRGAASQESLLAIQNEEKIRAEAEQVARDNERRRQAAEQSKITPKGWTAGSNTSALSLAEIQQQEEEERRRQQAEANKNAAAAPATTSMSVQLKSLLGVKPAAAPAAASTGPAWGSGSAPAPANKSGSSLRDIMQEEEGGEGAASPVKGAASNAPRKPISWAAKAGSSGVVSAAPAPAAPVRVLAKPVVAAPVAAAAAPARAAPSTSSANKEKEKSSFGGKEMSKDMADWCAAQLKRLNGSDDLTLMHFCMSLDSAADIRQYLSEYLGSSAAVINFATDFIKYKEGGKKAVDAAAASAGGAAGASSGNNNNPSTFVSANKKKKAPSGAK